jgi:hypothetical protein
VLTSRQASQLADDLLKEARPEWARMNRFVRYARGKQKLPWLPDSAETEYREIARKSASNWLDLVVSAVTQGLSVDGYDDGDVWAEAWQANRMDAYQDALYRAGAVCGYAYLLAFPSEDDGVWMAPESATKLYARYDADHDEWPTVAVREVRKDKIYELYDDEARYTLTGGAGSRVVVVAEHDAGVCPVVKVPWALDLLGTPMGEVEPVIPIQDRIVDATFTLQMVAKYGAFPQRWISGIDITKPLTDTDGNPILDGSGKPVFPTIKAYVDHILTAMDPDTKFGQFAAADLRQYVEALEAHIKHLAAITQTPPHYLLGSLVNLSAEALAAAESGLMRKVREKTEILADPIEQALRLAAGFLGLDGTDTSARVHWANIESRSLAQVADALMKLSQLGVPLPKLLPMVPGFTRDDVDEAIALMAEQGDSMDALMDRLTAGQTSPSTPDDASVIKAKADAMGVLIRAGVSSDSAAGIVGLTGAEFTGAVPVSLRLPESAAGELEQS